jgi:hypothetical protein
VVREQSGFAGNPASEAATANGALAQRLVDAGHSVVIIEHNLETEICGLQAHHFVSCYEHRSHSRSVPICCQFFRTGLLHVHSITRLASFCCQRCRQLNMFFSLSTSPVWTKALALLLALPSLYFAVFSVLYYPPLHIGGR